MAKKKFFIGDILNLLFYDVNDECELFLDDDRSEGIDDLLAFMLGLSTDPQKSPEKLKKIGVSEAADYFEDNHRFSLAMQVCIESLLCQFECFTERRFRDELKSMKKRANKSSFGEEIETNWLTQQARLYAEDQATSGTSSRRVRRGRKNKSECVDDEYDVTMLEVESIGYLHIPAGQERFERVSSFELFNDRPMNTNSSW